MMRRRMLTVPGFFILAVILIALSPILLLVSVILSISPKLRTLPHAVLFAIGLVVNECVAVVRLTWVWLRYRNDPSFIPRNQALQFWWAQSLLSMGQWLYQVKITLTGRDALPGPSAIVFARHASMADNVLPLLYFSGLRDEGMRYVIKKELLVLPALDIGGNRVPTFFIDRSGDQTERELEELAKLTATAPETESLLLYPEGTRFSPGKQARLRAKSPALAEQVQRWPDLLPPRTGGASTMLTANPGKDIVGLAHVGFEGSASLSDLLNGSWRGKHVRIRLWRTPYADIPADHSAFLFSLWDQMQQHLVDLRNEPSE